MASTWSAQSSPMGLEVCCDRPMSPVLNMHAASSKLLKSPGLPKQQISYDYHVTYRLCGKQQHIFLSCSNHFFFLSLVDAPTSRSVVQRCRGGKVALSANQVCVALLLCFLSTYMHHFLFGLPLNPLCCAASAVLRRLQHLFAMC